jgi:hypothetical protein
MCSGSSLLVFVTGVALGRILGPWSKVGRIMSLVALIALGTFVLLNLDKILKLINTASRVADAGHSIGLW